MQSMTIDKKAGKIIFQDQNRNLVFLLRFIVGLNLINAVIFFLLFNNEDDILKYFWLAFALLNVVFLYLLLTRLSAKQTLDFKEVKGIQRNSLLGILFKLKDGKFRKAYVHRNSEDAEKLIKMFSDRQV